MMLTTVTKTSESLPASQREPSLREVLVLALLSWLIFIGFITRFEPYRDKVVNFGDSQAYMDVANAILGGDFTHLVVKQFWGLPLAMAALSRLSGMSTENSLLCISFFSFLATCALAHRLWGGWVAAFFTLLNFDWLQRSFLGGAEPLFVALLFGGFLAFRRSQWLLAAMLMSLATTVRPLGIIALIGLGVVLLYRREYKKCAIATGVGIAVGLLYTIELRRAVGDPLATVHSYSSGPGPGLFGIPFYAIVKGTATMPAPWTNLVLSISWIVLITLGVSLLLLSYDFKDFRKSFPVEAFFTGSYFLTICSYNSPYWARGTFPRFAIPIIPFALIGVSRWVPKVRWLPRLLVVVGPALAAASAIGIVNVAHRAGLR